MFSHAFGDDDDGDDGGDDDETGGRRRGGKRGASYREKAQDAVRRAEEERASAVRIQGLMRQKLAREKSQKRASAMRTIQSQCRTKLAQAGVLSKSEVARAGYGELYGGHGRGGDGHGHGGDGHGHDGWDGDVRFAPDVDRSHLWRNSLTGETIELPVGSEPPGGDEWGVVMLDFLATSSGA